MTLTRRKTLALIGGGTILAAGAAGAAFWTTRTPHRALQPWHAAGSGYAEPRKRALSYAILAPNPHNLQPWLVELAGEDTVRLHRDPARSLPETDPEARQITIGLGCFLELLALAASEDGHATDITLYPAGEAHDRPVAEIRFAAGGTSDPLFRHALARRSCKEPFDMARPVPAAALDPLRAAAGTDAPLSGTTDAARTAALRDLIWAAWNVEATTPRTYAESIDLLRIGRPEIEATPDGIDLQSPMLEVLRRSGLLGREALLDTDGTGFRSTMEAYRATFAATPAFVWITTSTNTRPDQIASGRAWLRANLAATGAGLGLHPVSQALQEYPEMAGLRAEVHGMLGKPGETVQMLGRLGYGPQVPPSPRWPLEAKMRDA